MTNFQHIRYTLDQGVAEIVIDRPAKLNALASQTLAELREAFERAAADGARAVLWSGEGRAFCSGADLVGSDGGVGVTGDLGAMVAEYYAPLVRAISELSIPVVCAVRGLAAGAGCSLALHADFVVAGHSAYFLFAFVNIGLVPDAGGLWIAARSIGRARALELAMLGERLPAERARAYGLIHQVVDDDRVLDEARALAARLARGPTMALGRIRRAVNAAFEGPLEDALAAEVVDQRDCGFSEDAREGIAAFVEKRPAVFNGR